MNSLARQCYEKDFQEVCILSEDASKGWSELSMQAPTLPRGWFELSRLSPEERIEFTRDFWFSFLPYHPLVHPILSEFFSRLDDIALVLAKKDEEFCPELVYSLADNSTFFRGLPPASEEDLRELRLEIDQSLPRDYLAFLKIHNGFGKLSEIGMLRIEDVGMARQRAKELLLNPEKSVTSQGHPVDPGSLIPFYEAYGLVSFQCFYADWYPGSEMGNVYLSGIDYTISDIRDRKNWGDNGAFATFMEWLIHYLEGMTFG